MNKYIYLLSFFLFFNLSISSQENDSNEIEEVIVTAQKKEERYVDVPVSVTTVSGEQLDIARVGYVQELVAAAPSVTYNRTAGMRGDGIYIRGIGTSLFQSGVEPTVSAVLDGVVLGDDNACILAIRVDPISEPDHAAHYPTACRATFNAAAFICSGLRGTILAVRSARNR